MKPLFFIAAAALLQAEARAQGTPPQLGKEPVKKIIAAMTLEEKAKMVVGMGFKMPGTPPPSRKTTAPQKDTARSKEGFALPPMDPEAASLPEKVPGAAGRTHGIPRLGIPVTTVSDGPAGVRIDPFRNGDSSRTYYATAFPVGTLLASSWDTALVEKLGNAFGEEIRDYGIDIILGPAMNIQRNPLGGRNFEYYSEDPLLSGKIAAAAVRGIQSKGVGTSIKHFAANNQETNRSQVNTILSERALREIYLRGFQIAVQESKPWTVMSSYNKINGTYASESPELLTTILRKEWGYRGMVMTDWFGGKDAVAQMQAGNDLLMPGTPKQSEAIVEAVKKGKLSEQVLDRNVEHILNMIILSPAFKNYNASEKPDLQTHALVARNVAAEAMVLLKNETTLPLAPGKRIALFGNTSYDPIAGGTGSGDVHKAYSVSLKEGLEKAGYTLDAALTGNYEHYIAEQKAKRPKPRFFFMLPPPIPEMQPDAAAIDREADACDAAVYTLGRNAGEGADRKVENDFDLSAAEKSLLKQLSDAFHARGKKLIVVLNIGGVVETDSWRGLTDAILLAWQPGQEGGHAIADVLSGKVNPSGKLAVSFPIRYDDEPTAKNFPGHELEPDKSSGAPSIMGRPAVVTYEEGVYVGYRYFNTFQVKTAYPFGYGLSYTRFDYSDLSLSSHSFKDRLLVSVKVTNTGQQPGKEVVELYLSAPAKTMDKPREELKAFAKTRLLAPGESQTVQLLLDEHALASFDSSKTRWVAEPGIYQVRIGASSEDIRLTGDFTLAKELDLLRLNKVMAPAVPVKELKK
jgi:beta-glucosidase